MPPAGVPSLKSFFQPSMSHDEARPRIFKQPQNIEKIALHTISDTASDMLGRLPPPEPLWNLPPASQIDPSILAALPQDLRDEIERELQPAAPVNISTPPSPQKSPQNPKSSPQKSARGRGRGRGRGIIMSKINARPSINGTDFTGKRSRIDPVFQTSDRSV